MNPGELVYPTWVYKCLLGGIRLFSVQRTDLIQTGGCRKDTTGRDFPGGPVVKNPSSNAGDVGPIPVWGTKISYTEGQLSPHTPAAEPVCQNTCLNKDPARPGNKKDTTGTRNENRNSSAMQSWKGRRQPPCWPLFLLPSDCPPWLSHPCRILCLPPVHQLPGLLRMQVSLTSSVLPSPVPDSRERRRERSNWPRLSSPVRQLKSPVSGQAVGGPGTPPAC